MRLSKPCHLAEDRRREVYSVKKAFVYFEMMPEMLA